MRSVEFACARVPRLTSDSTLTPSAVEEVKGAEALGTPVIEPLRRAPASSVSAVAPPDWKR
jgi:hypothetical protein